MMLPVYSRWVFRLSVPVNTTVVSPLFEIVFPVGEPIGGVRKPKQVQFYRRTARPCLQRGCDSLCDALGLEHSGNDCHFEDRCWRLIGLSKLVRIYTCSVDNSDINVIRLEAKLAKVISVLEKIMGSRTPEKSTEGETRDASGKRNYKSLPYPKVSKPCGCEDKQPCSC